MSAQARQRLLTVDIAKGVGILLVVLGHNPVFRVGAHSLYEGLYLFHMPLFFFLSGLTFRLAPPGVTVRKRARSLLVPYFAMGAIAVGAALLTAGPEQAVAELFGVFYGTGHTIRFVPLWFLPCLFLVSIALTWYLHVVRTVTGEEGFDRARHASLIALAVVGLVAGGWLLTSGIFGQPPYVDTRGRPLGLPWNLDLVPFVLAMFIAGALCARASWVRACPKPMLVLLAAAGILATLVANNVSLDLNYRRMTGAGGVVLAIAAGIVLVLALSTLLTRIGWISRLFAYLGSASLVILLLHSPVQRRVLHPFLDRDLNDGVTVFLSVSITVAVICVFDQLILRRVRALGWLVYPRREVAGTS